MNRKFIDCLMNPVMCRLFMDIKNSGEMTAKQLVKAHSDISQATLYRYLKRMTDDGLIKIMREAKIRGTLERTFALAIDFNSSIESLVESNSGEAYLALFVQYMSGISKLFGSYCARDDINIRGDISTFNAVPIYATDEEIMGAFNEIENIIMELVKNAPTEGRRLRTIGTILTPPQDEKIEEVEKNEENSSDL